MNAISIREISKDETKHPCMHASEIEKRPKYSALQIDFCTRGFCTHLCHWANLQTLNAGVWPQYQQQRILMLTKETWWLPSSRIKLNLIDGWIRFDSFDSVQLSLNACDVGVCMYNCASMQRYKLQCMPSNSRTKQCSGQYCSAV